ncbi:hypothetical protein [Aeromonas jandaei]|uniref:hypothetical protein n=1 Tax=Aeromonas jandaei TaxID=650 RepID=UPI000F5255EA|nr:hypothetical protein [Aeromonas jandaei]RQM70376.1 hypothetical protein EHZ47_22050 [Aeromonas jandaei]
MLVDLGNNAPQIPSEMLDSIHADYTERFWLERADIMVDAANHIQSIIMEAPHSLSAEQQAWFLSHYGEDVAGPIFDFFDRQQEQRKHIPEGFIECLAEFLELKKPTASHPGWTGLSQSLRATSYHLSVPGWCPG